MAVNLATLRHAIGRGRWPLKIAHPGMYLKLVGFTGANGAAPTAEIPSNMVGARTGEGVYTFTFAKGTEPTDIAFGIGVANESAVTALATMTNYVSSTRIMTVETSLLQVADDADAVDFAMVLFCSDTQLNQGT